MGEGHIKWDEEGNGEERRLKDREDMSKDAKPKEMMGAPPVDENVVKVQTSNIEMSTVMPPSEERVVQSYDPDIGEEMEKVTVKEQRDGKSDQFMVMIKNTEYEPPTAEPLPDPELRKKNSVEQFWCKMNDQINQPLGIDRVMSDTMMRRSIDTKKVVHPASAQYSYGQPPPTTEPISPAPPPTNFPKHYYQQRAAYPQKGRGSKSTSSRKSKQSGKSTRKQYQRR